ncbi:t-SNARE [Microthyrium microscopicum]|uniref:t-SNARE n=1 Tax=Microthyrium microscopicum TaxID=703497 RepID=A0A6A6UGJ1_9PEZI|nr:t-SNARE [Microthyrium microscopicum]
MPSQHAQQPQAGGYGAAPANVRILTQAEFLENVDEVSNAMKELDGNIARIAELHQRAISSTDQSITAQLEDQVSNTQHLNHTIRQLIRRLEEDSARRPSDDFKRKQIARLKNSFKDRLNEYTQEEQQYKRRYQDQIGRQYRIVNPQATEEEVREAQEANWGDEGVFQTALKSNRAGAATSALGAVRARHNDIQRIEKTITELAAMFTDLDQIVTLQAEQVNQVEQQTDNVKTDTEAANVQLTKGIDHARRARKLKWVCCGIITVIVLALALGLGIYFGAVKPNNDKNNNPPAATKKAKL